MADATQPRAADLFANEEPRSWLRGFIANRALFEDISGTDKATEERDKLPAEAVEWLDSHGFEYVCSYTESMGGFPVPRLNGVTFVDPSGTIRVSLRHNSSMHFEPKGVMYTFYSYLDDGSAVVTWCVAEPKTKSTGRLESLGTTGSMAEDYARQRSRVQDRATLGPVPVVVKSPADVEATYFHYYRQVIPDAGAKQALAVWLNFRAMPVFYLLVGIVAAVWMWLE